MALSSQQSARAPAGFPRARRGHTLHSRMGAHHEPVLTPSLPLPFPPSPFPQRLHHRHVFPSCGGRQGDQPGQRQQPERQHPGPGHQHRRQRLWHQLPGLPGHRHICHPADLWGSCHRHRWHHRSRLGRRLWQRCGLGCCLGVCGWLLCDHPPCDHPACVSRPAELASNVGKFTFDSQTARATGTNPRVATSGTTYTQPGGTGSQALSFAAVRLGKEAESCSCLLNTDRHILTHTRFCGPSPSMQTSLAKGLGDSRAGSGNPALGVYGARLLVREAAAARLPPGATYVRHAFGCSGGSPRSPSTPPCRLSTHA